MFGKTTIREIKIDNCIFQQEVVFCVKLKRQVSPQPDPNEKIIPLEAKIGLTPNKTLILNLSMVKRSIKKETNSDHERTLPGPQGTFCAWVPQNILLYHPTKMKKNIPLEPKGGLNSIHCLNVYKKYQKY